LTLLSDRSVGFIELLGELLLGIAMGLVIPWIVIGALESRLFGVYERLGAVSIGLLIFAVASLSQGQ
jgi:hypothetical protein